VKAKRILVGLLATIGALTMLASGYVAILFGLVAVKFPELRPPDRDISAILSPNGQYKAITIWMAGGGAISPFCTESVFVVSASVPNEAAERDEKNMVYGMACDRSSPSIVWTSNDMLQITFSIDEMQLHANKPHLKKWGASGSVQVRFVTR
jgi:hypothetical protein